jgi:hypothetical protein
VNKVKTKPTLLAALAKAIVLIAETVKIFIVRLRTYMPTPYNKKIGSLAKIVEGKRNQKSPTPKVKKAGKIKTRRVAFKPKLSNNVQTKNKTVKTDKSEIPTNL